MAIPRISEFIILAQITVGSILGIKLASIRISEITKYLQDAVTSIILILSTYLVVGLLTAYFANTNFLEMFLAFAPGGFYEITLLGIIFGFDMAFVAFHHTIRVIIVFLALPILMSKNILRKMF